jgi:hypothetical protein
MNPAWHLISEGQRAHQHLSISIFCVNYFNNVRQQSVAYDSAGKSVVPGDFQSALDGNARARDFFAELDSRNRYAVVQNSNRQDSRNAREADFTVCENAGAARKSSSVTRLIRSMTVFGGGP